MSDLDALVSRIVGTVTTIADTASRFAVRLLVGASVICTASFLLGVAALSDGIEAVWLVLGIVFGTIAIGGPLVAWWRVRSVRRHAPALVEEVRSLVSQERAAGRTVIETFDVDDPARPPGGRGSAIVMTRNVGGLRDAMGSRTGDFTRLSAATAALVRFPLMALASIAITAVFAFVGFLFLIALAL